MSAIAHSFRVQPDTWDYTGAWLRLHRDIEILLTAAEVFHGLTVYGPCGTGPAHLSASGIAFNGDARLWQHAQPLVLTPPDRSRQLAVHGISVHCRVRTDCHPYDLLVKAALLRMRHRLPDICRIGSTRSWRTWQAAYDLTARVFGGDRRGLHPRVLSDTTAGLVWTGRAWTDPRAPSAQPPEPCRRQPSSAPGR